MVQIPRKQNYVADKSQVYFDDSDVNTPEERTQPRAAVIRVLLLFSLISMGWTASSWCEVPDVDWEGLLGWSELVADITARDVFDNDFDEKYIKSVVDNIFQQGNWTLTSDQIGILKQTYRDRLEIKLNELNERTDPPKSQKELNKLLDSAADMFEKALDQFKQD